MLKRITLSLMLAATVASGAFAQQRVARRDVNRPVALSIERSGAEIAQPRNFAPTYQRGLRAVNPIHDASAVAKSYTATPPMRVLGDGTVLYGSIIYSDAWVGGGAQYGLYSFTASATPTVTKKLDFEGGYLANGGGTYADGKYYYNSYVYTEEMGYTFSTFNTVDVATGETTRMTQSFISGTFDQTQITHDMAYDPTTGTIFAIAYIKETIAEGAIERFRPAISTVDDYTGFVTPIAQTPGFIAIAVNNAGELYGITKGAQSSLYRINKATAECTLIGATGLNPEYVQSATFDPVTDKLYWAETGLNGKSGLYEVNVATGKAELICNFPNNEEFTGIYIPEPVVADAAPAAVTDQTAVFDGASLSGKLTFTVPTLNYGGAALTGALVAEISVDGADFSTLDVTPGQKVSLDITLAEGTHGYSVAVGNAAGEGPRTGYSWYVGIDGPEAVGNLRLEANGAGEPVISWTAPAAGRNGGYIDPAKLTYTVVRQPEGAEVAKGIRSCSFTDRGSFKAANVYYTVTAYCDGREGVEAATDEALFGSGSELPVTFSFDTVDEFNLCTTIDANGDADTEYKWGYWMYGPDFPAAKTDEGCAVYGFSIENADDWIIMPPYTAESGKKYRVTFKSWNSSSAETMAVTAGPAATVAAQTVVMPAASYNSKEAKTYSAEFTATASGNYYIGFHVTSAKKAGYLFIDDVTVDIVPENNAPAAVADMTVTPGDRGALTATIALKAPETNADGSALAALDRIEIYRGNENTAIHTFSSPAPGSSLSWTDTEPMHGFNTYRAVAFNANGAGEKALATAYIGYDIPTAAQNVELIEREGHPVLKWEAPTTGQNGGYINSSELIYRIVRSDNVIMSARATGTEFVDMSLDPTKHQYFIYYQIEPVSEAGVGDYALSNHIIFGDPYQGEFFESFEDAALSTDPWTMYRIKGNSQLWTIMSQGTNPGCYDADQNGGLAAFVCSNGRVGDEGRLVSPKLRIDDMNVPTFYFAFYHNPDEDTLQGAEPFEDRMIPEVCLPDGSYVALDQPIYVDDADYDYGWYLYRYDLSRFKEFGYVQLSFHGIASFGNDIYVDYVGLENNVEHDLIAYTFSGPSGVKPGKSAKYKFTVFNQGTKAVPEFSVSLFRDGKEFMTSKSVKTLYSGSYMTFDFAVPATVDEEGKTYAYSAVIMWDDDDIPANNTSGVIRTEILSPDVPQVRTVKGTLQGENNVLLEWGEADALHVNDSFETYAAYSIEDIGDYKLVDADGGYTYTFQDINYTNAGDPMAFMVFNPVQLGIAPMLEEWTPRTGSQVLAAFAACDAEGKPIKSDDWLISPELHKGTEVSFWAKTANYEWGLEKFEVMYSTGDASTSSFVSLTGEIDAPKDWTLFTYTLPAESRYFAIHYVTSDGFVFYLDDLKYKAVCSLEGATLSGFRVYCDGRAIGDVDAAERSFTDLAVEDGLHTYGVAALFGSRESKRVSVDVQVGESGVEDAGAAAVSIYVDGGVICIDGAEGRDVTVATPAGITVFAASDSESYRVAAAKGVYLVKAGNAVRKLVVK